MANKIKAFIFILILLLSISCFFHFIPEIIADTQTLDCNFFRSVFTEWDEYGMPPYLDDNNNYIMTKTDEARQAWFAYENMASSGTLDAVIIYFKANILGGENDKFEVFLDATGIDETDVGDIFPANSTLSWYSINVSSTIDTWQKLGSCESKLVFQKVGGATDYISISQSYLHVTYTPPPPYTFDLMVLFLNQTGANNANITLVNDNDDEIFHVQTNSSGQISTQNVSTSSPNPHTLTIFREGIRRYVSVFDIEGNISLIITVHARLWKQGTTGITLKETCIPHIKTYYVDHTFYFVYKHKYGIGLEPFIIYNGNFYNIKQIINFLQSKGINYEWAIKKIKRAFHYGFNLSAIPSDVAQKLDYVGFKLAKYNFPLSLIKLAKYDNITEISIPKINFHLSFQDLEERGYTIKFVNKTYLLIGGVTNQSSLDIDPILYSDNVLSIIGNDAEYYNEATACNSTQIADVNDAEGWGVVDALAEQLFIFDARIVFGDAINQTWFVDENVQWLFSENATSLVTQPVIHLKKNATFKISDCQMMFDTNGRNVFRAENGSILRVEGSHIVTSYLSTQHSIRIYAGGNLTLSRSNLENTFLYISPPSTVNVERVVITDALYGMYSVNGTFDDVLIISTDYGIHFVGGYSCVLRNIEIRGVTWVSIETVAFDEKGWLIDCDLETWNFLFDLMSDGEIYRQYSFDTTVFFQNGSYAQGANVTISNAHLGISQSWIIGANGSIPTQIYSYGHYNRTRGNNIYDYNPYNISVSLDGFAPYFDLIDITRKEALRIVLTPETEAFRITWLVFGLIIAVCVAIVFALAISKKR